MADIDKDRDWDKEMAEVDRLLKKLPAADPSLGRPSGGEPTVRRPAAAPGSAWSGGAGGGPPSARDRVGTWAKPRRRFQDEMLAHTPAAITVVTPRR